MQAEWRQSRQATISSQLQWFWLSRRFDRRWMKVHITSPPGTADTVIHGPRSVAKPLYIYWTAESKPYPDQLSYSDNDVQGHTSTIKKSHQWACSPEAGEASKHLDPAQGHVCARQEAERGEQARPRGAAETNERGRLSANRMRVPHSGNCV